MEKIKEFTFSDFAKILFPYLGYKDNQAEFVITLTDTLFARPAASGSEGFRNPLRNYQHRYLNRFYSGERDFPRKHAREILGSINMYRFEEFVRESSDIAQSHIAEELNSAGFPSVSQLNVAEKCADIFKSILIERAKPKPPDTKKEIVRNSTSNRHLMLK